jgi:hypothetical protein
MSARERHNTTIRPQCTADNNAPLYSSALGQQSYRVMITLVFLKDYGVFLATRRLKLCCISPLSLHYRTPQGCRLNNASHHARGRGLIEIKVGAKYL